MAAHGVVGLVRAATVEFAERGIRVFAIALGEHDEALDAGSPDLGPLAVALASGSAPRHERCVADAVRPAHDGVARAVGAGATMARGFAKRATLQGGSAMREFENIIYEKRRTAVLALS